MKKLLRSLLLFIMLFHNFVPLGQLVYSETISETSKNAVSTEMTSTTADQTTQSTKADTQPTTTAPSSDIQHETQPATVSLTQEENTFSTTRPSAVRSNEQKNKKAEGPTSLQLAKEPTPAITIDYKRELLLDFDSTAKYKLILGTTELRVENVSEYKITDDMMGKTSHGNDWKIIRVASDTSKQDSDPFTLNIPMRNIISSNYITSRDETVKGANDGRLNMNFTSFAVEYRKKGAENWTPVVGMSVTGLAPGTYEARYQATDTSFASLSREYEIKAGLEKEVTPKITIDFKKELLLGFDSTAKYKLTLGNTELTVENASEYKITDDMMGKTSHGNEWEIIRVASDTSKQDSDPFTLNIPMRNIISSNYITSKDETVKDANDGRLDMNFTSFAVEYRKKGAENWTPVVGMSVTGLAPGTYEARYQATDTSFASLSREYEIKAGLEKEATPKITIDYKKERLLGFDSTAKYKLTLGNTELTVENASEYKITDDMMGKTSHGNDWKIIRVANDAAKQDSDPFTLNIPMRNIISSNYITSRDETVKGANDGRLNMNFTSFAVEYRKKGAENWTPVVGMSVTGLAPGTYEARYQATDTSFASLSREYEIKAGLEKEATPKITIDFKKELLLGFDSTAKYKLTLGNTELTVENASEYKITDDMMGKTSHGNDWKIIRVANDAAKQDSDPFTLNIPMRNIISSNYITSRDETVKGANDGRLNMNFTSFAVEYRKKGAENWTPVVGMSVTGLAPGTYEARYQATDTSFASLSREYEIKAGLEKEATPKITIDFKKELLLGFDSTAKYKLTLGNTELTVENASEYKITDDMMGKTSHGNDWKIIQVASDTSKQDSDPFTLNIPMRNIISSNYITPKDETVKDANDGRLDMNYNSYAVECREKGVENWTPVEGTAVTGLAPGTYEARYQATDTSFASLSREYEIKAGPERQESLQVEPKSLDFEAPLGYDPNALLKEITITNSSEDKVTNIALTTSETAAFKIENTVINELDAGKSVNFTIAPVEDLAVGIYKMTVDISSDNAVTVSIPVSFEVFAEGKVVVRYQDDKGKNIADTEVFSGKIGERFTTERKEIEGYHFKEVQGNSSGTFSEKEQTITYVYTKQETVPEKGGDVTVNYVDEAGKKLAESELLSGNIGAAYETKQKTIKGYSFKELQGNAKGNFTSKAQTVTYIYKKTAVSGVTNATKPKSGGTTSQKGSVSSQKALLKAGETRNRLVVFSGLVFVTCSIISLYVKRKYQMTDE
ncbi:MucBP domain-containing protein [Enterococcus sp. DIV0756]|uniref:MucBP domain-containing protein n=1 Tax=Enterococcus sp. DIV0756 TaxID=2774636 RepID=UPI003F21F40F